MADKPKSRVNLKTGEEPAPEPVVVQPVEYEELHDEFSELKQIGDDRVETERLSKYFLDDTDIEGKSFVDRGEKIIFTLVSIMADYPKFQQFRLERLPKKWLHYALGESGRGRVGVFDILKGKVEIRPPQNPNELPGLERR
jgi:hypothetical protein